jgi:hypothetical protein
MASEADSCWRCGVLWATEVAPRPALRAIAGDGGSIAAEAPAPLRAVAARA